MTDDDLSPIRLDLPLQIQPPVNLAAVELLRAMLVRAEQGLVQDVAILTARDDGTVGVVYDGSGTKRWANLLSACEVLRCRLLTEGV